MKQLVVAPCFPFSTHTFLTREVAETVARGHDVLILAPDDGDAAGHVLANRLKLDMERVIYLDVSKMPLFSADWRRFSARLRKAAQRKEYGHRLAAQRKTYFSRLLRNPQLTAVQLIHAHWTGWAYEIAMPLSRLLGVPYTLTAHDGHLASKPNDQLRLLQNSAAAITLPSNAWREIWQKKTGSNDRLHVLPNAVDTGEFHRGGLQSESGTLNILTIGRLIPSKRVEDGLHAVQRLMSLGVSCRYTVVGAGPELQSMIQLATRLNIDSHIDFLGAQSHDRVLSELSRCDIYLHPSASESFGVAVIEAMAAFLPVIAAESAGTKDTVVPGVTGLLYRPGDIDALVNALLKLSRHPELRSIWGDAGRARAETLYGWNGRMNFLCTLWDQALSSGNPK